MPKAPKVPDRISLADVETKSERVLPGTYHAKVVAVPIKLNKAGDGYFFNPDYQILSEGASKNRHVWDILPLKEAALFKLKGFLAACGVEDDNPATDEIEDLTVGCIVDIVVGEEEWQGEPRPRVLRVRPSTMPTLDDLAEEEEEDEDEEVEEGDEWTEDELNDLSIKELRDVAKEAEVYEKGMTKADLISAILGEEDEDEEEEDEPEDDEDEDEDLFDEDEEEEEPAPKTKKRVARK